MKKTFSILFLIMISFLLMACDRTVEDDGMATVYYYEYRNAYKQDQEHPDIIRSQVFEKGKTIEKPEDPVREGYMFLGWYKDIEKETEWNFSTDILETNTVLYAKWDNAVYRVDLEFNEGKFPENTRFNGEYDEETDSYYYLYEPGTSQSLYDAERTGYDFLGWHKTNEIRYGDRRLTQVERSLREDTTYYAHWELKRITVRFNINLDENKPNLDPDPNQIPITVLDYGEEMAFPELVDKSGTYEFIGWNTRSDGSGEYLINGEPLTREFSTVLYAQWAEK